MLVLADSKKLATAATWKKTFGHHPLVAFVDHGQAGSAEPAGAAAARRRRLHHNEVTSKQPGSPWPAPHAPAAGPRDAIRTDSSGGTHAFADRLSRRSRQLLYSDGMTTTDTLHQNILKIPKQVSRLNEPSPPRFVSTNPVAAGRGAGGPGPIREWLSQRVSRPWSAVQDRLGSLRQDSRHALRSTTPTAPSGPGAWVTDVSDLSTWPTGMRLIVCGERSHPGT